MNAFSDILMISFPCFGVDWVDGERFRSLSQMPVTSMGVVLPVTVVLPSCP
jgi:hypothetical protein